MTLEEFVSRLEGQKNWSNGNYQCRCPAHEDRVQSLSVTEDEEKILFYCHAGCDWKDVICAMGIEAKDLYKPFGTYFPTPYYMQQPEAIYQYKNADGTLAYEVVRFPGKKFRQRRFSDGGMVWNMDGVKRIPYNLPRLYACLMPPAVQGRIYITEGEKDADRICQTENNLATCFVGGANKKNFLATYVKWFKELNVVIIADKDEPGLAYAREIKDALTGVAASVIIMQAAVGKDVSDHLDAGKTLDELEEVE